ncbi:MAG TPA: UDP-4-amino-4,6-dideoxy-N-acetyl-beta-L-altrosamine transaminase [Nitrospirae bacterium]|nr:UDP-4-amino-4,6-dideoxy-N-acetyl-beta-L-altrosamine transaminase [Nitrospirota bacterium]
MKIPFHKPYITEDEISGVVEVLRSGWLTTGPRTKEFESAFADFVGAGHAVALNSGTAALHLALEAIGLKEGEEVITTTMTFAATAEVVRYFGARPVLVDIDPETMNMDVSLLEEAISSCKRPRAIIPVHYGGLPCDMDAVISIAKKHGMAVIEDAAHALPASYKGRSIGSISDITCFSFYATKNITTGEGGMAVTDNEEYAERMRVMSLHGISRDAWKRYSDEGNWYYEIIAPGYKYNMTDIAAAVGLAQLKRADEFRTRREEIASAYSKAFRDVKELQSPGVSEDMLHSWHLYPLRLNLDMLSIDRAEFIEHLKERSIGTSVHFIPLHIHPYYKETYGYVPEDFPVAYGEYKRIVSLPIYPLLSDSDVQHVVDAVVDTARENAR